MRSIAQQHPSEMGGRFSVLACQKRDHIRLDGLLNRLPLEGRAEQDRTLLRIYRLVFPHAFAEESVLWPAIRRALPDGHELTLQVEQEHQEINELVTRLESLDRSASERPELLDAIVALLRVDVRDEEDLLLPRLQSRLSVAQLRWLGFAWEMVRLIAPTRAHPIVSRRPPGNVLAALPLSLLDRCRDGVDMMLERTPGAAAAPLRTVSAVLSHASRSVERLPGMQGGEDRGTRLDVDPLLRWGSAAFIAMGAAAMIVSWRDGRRAASS